MEYLAAIAYYPALLSLAGFMQEEVAMIFQLEQTGQSRCMEADAERHDKRKNDWL